MSNSLASLFKSLTTGVYVVGVAHGEARNAFTAAFVMQASYDPLLLALSINPHHSSYGLLQQGGAFSVNVLTKGQLELAARFGAPAGFGKLASTEWTPGSTGVRRLLRVSLLVDHRLRDRENHTLVNCGSCLLDKILCLV